MSTTTTDNITKRLNNAIGKVSGISGTDIAQCVKASISILQKYDIFTLDSEAVKLSLINAIAAYLEIAKVTSNRGSPSPEIISAVTVMLEEIKGIAKVRDKNMDASTMIKIDGGICRAFKSLENKLESTIETTTIKEAVPAKAKPLLKLSDIRKKSSPRKETLKSKSTSKKGTATDILNAGSKSWVDLQRSLFMEHGLPPEFENDRLYTILPEDMQAVYNSKGLYLSVAKGIAFYKHNVTQTIPKEDGKGNLRNEEVTFTVARLLFSKIPDRVHKIQIPDANKGQGTMYEVTVGTQKRLVSYQDLQKSTWADKFEIHMGVVNSMTNSQMCLVLDTLSRDVDVSIGSTRTGIHKIDGKFAYLYMNDYVVGGDSYKSGRLKYAAQITDDKRDDYAAYIEKTKVWDIEKVRDSLRYSRGLNATKMLSLIDVCCNIASLGASIRTEVFQIGFSRLKVGGPRIGKTSSETFAQKVGRPTHYKASSDFTGRGTVTRLEKYLHSLGDTSVLLDDFEPRKTSDEDTFAGYYEMIAKSAYDHAAMRPRCDSDLTDKSDYVCNSFPTLTGTKFPTSMTKGSLYRMLIIEIQKGDFNTISGEYNLKDAHNLHSEGLGILGYEVIKRHIENLNILGMSKYAEKRYLTYSDLRCKFEKVLTHIWSEYSTEELPYETDNLIDVGGAILLAAQDIDTITDNLENILETVLLPLARIVFEQLMLIDGQRTIEGDKIMTHLLKTLFEHIAESRTVGGKLIRIYDKKTGEEPILNIMHDGILKTLPSGQFVGTYDTNNDRKDFSVIYVDFEEGKELEGSMYLNASIKQALLTLAKEGEETAHIHSSQKLASMAITEGLLVRRGKKHVDVSFRDNNNVKQDGLQIKLSLVLPLLYDFELPDAITKGDTPKPTVTSNGYPTSMEDLKSFVDNYTPIPSIPVTSIPTNGKNGLHVVEDTKVSTKKARGKKDA